MRTDDHHFQDRFAEISAKIADLPEAQRLQLAALADETRRRHEENGRNIEAAKIGLTRLTVLRELEELQMRGLVEQLSGLKNAVGCVKEIRD